MGFELIGTGSYVPGAPVTNDQLAKVMDTSDEWIFKRSGIRQRHYAPEGVGASDLACEATKRAIEAAGIAAARHRLHRLRDDDAGLHLPGSGRAPRAQARPRRRAGARHSPAVRGDDLRAADRSTASSAAASRRRSSSSAPRRTPASCRGRTGARSSPAARRSVRRSKAKCDEHRALAVLFGDGAGAMIFRATDRDAGLLGRRFTPTAPAAISSTSRRAASARARTGRR